MLFSNREIPSTYHLIDTPKKLSWLHKQLSNVSEYGFDIETNHPTTKSKKNKYPAGFVEKLGGISFSWNYTPSEKWKPGNAAYIPIINSDDSPYWKSRHSIVLEILDEILTNDADKVAQNGKFDVRKLCELEDIRVKNFNFDIMLAHVLLDEDRLISSHGLKSDFSSEGKIIKLGMSDAYLDTSASQFKDDMESDLKFYDPIYKRYTKVPLKILYPYGCSDSDYLLPLKHIFKKQLEQEGMLWIFENLMMPLSHELTLMELHGVPIDIDRAKSIKIDQEIIMDDVGRIINDICGKEINVGSSTQLGELLFIEMGLKGRKNEHGQWLTDADTLKDLDHPIIEHILKWKRAQKIHGSYAVAALDSIKEVTDGGKIGWIHTNHFMLTVTGRLTQSEPTLNALPRPENGGDIVKSMFFASDGYVFTFKDYSQIELREIAHFSGEPLWIEGFENGLDMHSAMAQKIWHPECKVEDIKKLHSDSRSNAKAVNFGIAFGKTIWSLARDLGITTEEADKLINVDYFGAAPYLKSWIDNMHQYAIDHGRVMDIFGRVRHLPDAQLVVPKSMRWPKKSFRPKCYREGPNLFDIDMTLSDLQFVTDEDLLIAIRQSGKNYYLKCANCGYFRSCIWNKEVKEINGKFQKAMRQSVNSPIQGSAVNMTSYALVLINKELRRQKLDASVVCHNHDEIGVYHHKSITEHVGNIMDYYMIDYMSKLTNFKVPLKVDTSVVERWNEKG